jgi:hypothetical protein
MIKINRILCPTDFSDASTAAFSYAIELARLFDAEVCFIHVIPVLPPPPADFSFESELLVFASALTKDAEQRLHKFLAERIPKKLVRNSLLGDGRGLGRGGGLGTLCRGFILPQLNHVTVAPAVERESAQ